MSTAAIPTMGPAHKLPDRPSQQNPFTRIPHRLDELSRLEVADASARAEAITSFSTVIVDHHQLRAESQDSQQALEAENLMYFPRNAKVADLSTSVTRLGSSITEMGTSVEAVGKSMAGMRTAVAAQGSPAQPAARRKRCEARDYFSFPLSLGREHDEELLGEN
jgi:hypothetical protein